MKAWIARVGTILSGLVVLVALTLAGALAFQAIGWGKEEATLLFAGLAALGALVVIGVQWKQVVDAREASRATLRPWVLVSAIDDASGAAEGGVEGFTVRLRVRNHGIEPAMDVRLRVWWAEWGMPRRAPAMAHVPPPDARMRRRGQPIETESVLGPGAEEPFCESWTGTQVEMLEPELGRVWYQIAGTIRYRDTMGREHETTFSSSTVRERYGDPPRLHFSAWPPGANGAT